MVIFECLAFTFHFFFPCVLLYVGKPCFLILGFLAFVFVIERMYELYHCLHADFVFVRVERTTKKDVCQMILQVPCQPCSFFELLEWACVFSFISGSGDGK